MREAMLGVKLSRATVGGGSDVDILETEWRRDFWHSGAGPAMSIVLFCGRLLGVAKLQPDPNTGHVSLPRNNIFHPSRRALSPRENISTSKDEYDDQAYPLSDEARSNDDCQIAISSDTESPGDGDHGSKEDVGLT